MHENKQTYKIKITPQRTLGPLEMDRIKALVEKGKIQGDEPTSVDPYTNWMPFRSYPELCDLILEKLASEGKKKNKKKQESEQNPSTRTIISSDVTKTMAEPLAPPQKDSEPNIEENTGSFGIPTLLNISMPEKIKQENPDLERTIVNIPVPVKETMPGEIETSEGGTRILSTEAVDIALQQYSVPDPTQLEGIIDESGEPRKNILGKPIDPSQYVTDTGKRRLLSRNTAAILAIGLLVIAYFSSENFEQKKEVVIVPRYHTFPYVEVNYPPRLGATPNPSLSSDLVEKGQALLRKETPSAYMIAIKKYLYPAVGRNPSNVDAKSLLASAYMRLSEIIPRDKRFFETIDQLLLPGPQKARWTPEYVVALSEYYQLLNRFDQAQEVVDTFLKIRATPELLYQKANIDQERKELDSALSTISKAIPPEEVQKANPRHLMLYISLLDKKAQSGTATQALKRLIKENPNYGPGLLFYVNHLYKSGKSKDALGVLEFLLNRPYLLNRIELAETFLTAAKVLETTKQLRRAEIFATAAGKIHYNQEQIDDILFRIRSKLSQTQKTYTFIVSGRQKEKSKQYELAQIQYTKALELNRLDPIPYLLLASLHQERGEVNAAIDRYQKALYTTKKRPYEAAFKLAEIYTERYELTKAQSFLKTAQELKAKKDLIFYMNGLIKLKQKREDLAEPLFENATRAGSRYTDLYILMGDLETEKKNQKLAEFYYSIALRYDPFHPKAMLGVALTRFYSDSPSRAISFLKDKLAAQPSSAPIMTNLAIIYLRSGDQDSGKYYLQNAIRSDSKYAQAFRLLGDLTKAEGDRQLDNYEARKNSYRYALASYEMYSRLAPNDPEGFKSTGDLYFDIRDLGAAAKNYHRVLELTPNYPEVRLRLAQISRNGGAADQAMKFIDEEISINPRSDSAYVEKGNIYMARKEFDLATKSFTEAARINEKNADALFGLGVVYHLQGSYDNALSLFSRVINLDPLKAEVYWQMGLIYQKQNNKVKASQAFTNYKGIVRDPRAIAEADKKLAELAK